MEDDEEVSELLELVVLEELVLELLFEELEVLLLDELFELEDVVFNMEKGPLLSP